MLIRTNMQDLIEKTHTKHYELYRYNRLIEMGFSDSNNMNGKILSISETYEAKQTELKAEIQKREDEIKEAFVTKVKLKEAELKEAEKEVFLFLFVKYYYFIFMMLIYLFIYFKLHDKFVLLKKQHTEQKERLEEKKRIFDEEKRSFQARKFNLEQARAGTLKMPKKK